MKTLYPNDLKVFTLTDRYKNLFSTLDQSALSRADKVHLRDQNLALLLRKIWAGHETTRATLARQTGLSRSSVSSLVDHLIDMRLVEERGEGISTGGRKPTILRFNYQSKFILGLDIGASHLGAIIIDLNGQVISWRQEPAPVRLQPAQSLHQLNRLIQEILDESITNRDQLLGVGIAVPSPISPQNPQYLSPTFMPTWRDINLIESISIPDNIPLLIDNDANVGALAEVWWGAGQGCNQLAFIKLGTGVGAGFIIDGKVFRGHGGSAGELGHMVIDPEGPTCVCGLQGCLVTFVGSQPILKHAQKLGLEHQKITELLSALKEGDPIARDVISSVAKSLGLAVAGLMNMMNPERVILGGDLALAGDSLLHPLRECVQTRSLWSAISNSNIVTSTLGEQVIALGAATSILQRTLTQPNQVFTQWRG